MLAAMGLSQAQVSIMPPSHFFISIVQRGIIIMFIAGVAGIMGIIVGMPIVGRSIVIMVVVFLVSEVVVAEMRTTELMRY